MLLYVWITIASIAIVFSEPAPYDALISARRCCFRWSAWSPSAAGSPFISCCGRIVAGGFIATTQAVIFDVPATHMGITLYLAFTSVVMAGFVAKSPEQAHAKLIMSAYMVAALVAAFAALVGYFELVPGAYDLFTEFGRARGTFKDPNVLGAFLVPALLYAFNEVMTGRLARAGLWLAVTPILLFGSLLSFSRGAWINLAVSLVALCLLHLHHGLDAPPAAEARSPMSCSPLCSSSASLPRPSRSRRLPT